MDATQLNLTCFYVTGKMFIWALKNVEEIRQFCQIFLFEKYSEIRFVSPHILINL